MTDAATGRRVLQSRSLLRHSWSTSTLVSRAVCEPCGLRAVHVRDVSAWNSCQTVRLSPVSSPSRCGDGAQVVGHAPEETAERFLRKRFENARQNHAEPVTRRARWLPWRARSGRRRRYPGASRIARQRGGRDVARGDVPGRVGSQRTTTENTILKLWVRQLATDTCAAELLTDRPAPIAGSSTPRPFPTSSRTRGDGLSRVTPVKKTGSPRPSRGPASWTRRAAGRSAWAVAGPVVRITLTRHRCLPRLDRAAVRLETPLQHSIVSARCGQRFPR